MFYLVKVVKDFKDLKDLKVLKVFKNSIDLNRVSLHRDYHRT